MKIRKKHIMWYNRPKMASISNSMWQNRKERSNIFTNYVDMAETAKRYVYVSE